MKKAPLRLAVLIALLGAAAAYVAHRTAPNPPQATVTVAMNVCVRYDCTTVPLPGVEVAFGYEDGQRINGKTTAAGQLVLDLPKKGRTVVTATSPLLSQTLTSDATVEGKGTALSLTMTDPLPAQLTRPSS